MASETLLHISLSQTTMGISVILGNFQGGGGGTNASQNEITKSNYK